MKATMKTSVPIVLEDSKTTGTLTETVSHPLLKQNLVEFTVQFTVLYTSNTKTCKLANATALVVLELLSSKNKNTT